MPELPEVETTLRGIKPHIQNKIVIKFTARQRQLRWLIPEDMHDKLAGKKIINITRRGKYLIFQLENDSFIMHLGMSGRLKILHNYIEPDKHDHVDIHFSENTILRYTDQRRFGSILYANGSGLDHQLIAKLGIEPFDKEFTGEHLFNLAKKRNIAIKAFIMENKTVVGVGNIYATEALFQTNIHPEKPANQISLEQMNHLVQEIKIILEKAIADGGTTLKDFLNSDGKPGYFVQKLKIYGRAGQACFTCNTIIKSLKIGQRTSSFCPTCQHTLKQYPL